MALAQGSETPVETSAVSEDDIALAIALTQPTQPSVAVGQPVAPTSYATALSAYPTAATGPPSNPPAYSRPQTASQPMDCDRLVKDPKCIGTTLVLGLALLITIILLSMSYETVDSDEW